MPAHHATQNPVLLLPIGERSGGRAPGCACRLAQLRMRRIMSLVTIARSRFCFALFVSLLFASSLKAEEKTLRINIPKRTKPTPVQTFYRDGVKAIEKHDYAKAKKLFYKAYLL